tara:strand:- start:119 stop:484 length:366 start_codon:yes stop_codon:yes gene_type:complete
MELTLQTNKSGVFIKNYENHKIYINDKVFENNIMIINSNITKWEITNLNLSTQENYKEILMAKPEIIIIGTGTKLIVPDNELIHEVHKKNIGIEFMITESACKTYNLLASENRNIAAGLLL